MCKGTAIAGENNMQVQTPGRIGKILLTEHKTKKGRPDFDKPGPAFQNGYAVPRT
jgi:hypothetical protein